MKLAIFSDTFQPSNFSHPAGGLGKVNLMLAEGLKVRGHDVTLYAGAGSQFSGNLIIQTREDERLSLDLSEYNVIIDGGHFHELSQRFPELPILNLSQDREGEPGRCAVFPTEAHRRWHHYPDGKVIHNGVLMPEIEAFGKRRGGYAAYLSAPHAAKQPIAAIQAAQLAGVKLIMAGPTPPIMPPGGVYIGPLGEHDKWEFLYHADMLIHPSSIEAGPLTVLEAQAVGTPVIVSGYGGSQENMSDGFTGFACLDVLEMTTAIDEIKVGKIKREHCRDWIRGNRHFHSMVRQYDELIEAVAKGERWGA